jgi:UDP-GlcNAc:undecaprenyl-phosphate GlcNAc-1-phosphate transferase
MRTTVLPWLFAVSLVTTLLAMPLARRLGARLGLLDHPHARKLQSSAVPRTGGLGMLAGLTAGTAVLVHFAEIPGFPINREIVAVLVGAVMIHLTGLLDDIFDLPALAKLGAQTLAVGVVISQGVVLERIDFPGEAAWTFGVLAVPLTAFFLLGFINALNLVDGLDGLASGIAAISSMALAIAGVLNGNYVLASLSTIVFGSVLGFLPYNFRREKTFLGDSGSMLLGYLLGVTVIAGSWFSGSSTPVFVGLACAVVPILDTVTTILRRARNGRRLFRPDSMHLHHRMVRFGLSPRRTVLTILAITFFAAGQALVFFVQGTRALLVATTAAALLAGVQMVHRRQRQLVESDTSFREILFYFLGAKEGRSPLMHESVGMAEVIAAVDAAKAAERAQAAPRWTLPWSQPAAPAAKAAGANGAASAASTGAANGAAGAPQPVTAD